MNVVGKLLHLCQNLVAGRLLQVELARAELRELAKIATGNDPRAMRAAFARYSVECSGRLDSIETEIKATQKILEAIRDRQESRG